MQGGGLPLQALYRGLLLVLTPAQQGLLCLQLALQIGNTRGVRGLRFGLGGQLGPGLLQGGAPGSKLPLILGKLAPRGVEATLQGGPLGLKRGLGLAELPAQARRFLFQASGLVLLLAKAFLARGELFFEGGDASGIAADTGR